MQYIKTITNTGYCNKILGTYKSLIMQQIWLLTLIVRPYELYNYITELISYLIAVALMQPRKCEGYKPFKCRVKQIDCSISINQ